MEPKLQPFEDDATDVNRKCSAACTITAVAFTVCLCNTQLLWESHGQQVLNELYELNLQLYGRCNVVHLPLDNWSYEAATDIKPHT